MRSYLFNSVINVSTGPEEEREMLTGVHVVRDIDPMNDLTFFRVRSKK